MFNHFLFEKFSRLIMGVHQFGRKEIQDRGGFLSTKAFMQRQAITCQEHRNLPSETWICRIHLLLSPVDYLGSLINLDLMDIHEIKKTVAERCNKSDVCTQTLVAQQTYRTTIY
eukprot:scaffold39965_cov80-Attheya_sp.AAC.1